MAPPVLLEFTGDHTMKDNSTARTYSIIEPKPREGGPGSAGQSGDTQGLPDSPDSGSESVKELAEEGQFVEAELLLSLEEDEDSDEVEEVHTRQVPEDDVPDEYLGDK